MTDSSARKRALRTRMRSRLGAIDHAERLAAAERACGHATRQPAWPSAGTIALYKAISGEFDADPLARAAWGEGKRVLLPRVSGSDLTFHVWQEGEALARGAFGVLEPSAAAVVALDEAELVFVPGLAFDPSGGRLGRGAGYYDRALDGLGARSGSARIVGLGFALQVVDEVPMTSLDVRMDDVLTEAGWTDCADDGAP